MKFTDLFIRRPVLATVISLLILLLGLRAIEEIQIRQFPKVETSQITIRTAYPGASADLMKGFVTTPIEQSIASAEGIDYITASSGQSSSTIVAHLRLNFDTNKAFTQIQAKVNEVRNQLPPESQSPVIQLSDERGSKLMYISFYSDEMSPPQVTDYLSRVVQPKLSTVEGVADAEILGAKVFAMRIWLDPDRLAAHDLTPADVAQAIRANNYLAAVGATKGDNIAINIGAATDLHSAKGFQDMVIKHEGGSLVRLRDVANVELGAENYDSKVMYSGKEAIFIGIAATPAANPLDTIDNVRRVVPAIQDSLPKVLHMKVVYDATEYIRSSINEVIRTIGEAGLIVLVVIFLFLGALRSVTIPVVTIPLSLIGVVFVMLALGYTVNLLTLLAMVLAIGLVVDDAIVVVENIHRHIEEGHKPFDAAILGAREIAGPVIAMTLTLAAVYAPIGFLGGITGALFTEFAFTLAGAVIISGVIALTLSPMMCSKLLTPIEQESDLSKKLDHIFEGLRDGYEKLLHRVLNFRPLIVGLAVVVVISCAASYMLSQKELAPNEDQSVIFTMASGPEDASIGYTARYLAQINDILASFAETNDSFLFTPSPTSAFVGMKLKPWGQRERTPEDLKPLLQHKLNQVAGLKAFTFLPSPLPGSGGGTPVQFVVSTTDNYRSLFDISDALMQAAQKSGKFIFVDNDLKFNVPKMEIHVDRDKAATLGIDMQQLGGSLATMLGGNYVNRFNLEGRSYKVIPQVEPDRRIQADQLNQYHVRAADGTMVPLSTVVSIRQTVQPSTLNEFQQLNSATISGVPSPGVSLGDALTYLQTTAKNILPEGYSVNYGGQSRQYIEEGSALLYTFFFAIIVIYLVLAAQFESFRDPLIILISVPLSMVGALSAMLMTMTTVNIYTQVGLVTLIGLISKHGILIVEFANKLQIHEGLTPRQAVEKAAAIRLRPILMTTAAMVLGVVPLLIASGAGAVSRFDIGLVIAAGMLVGTAFTLFVVPTMYTYLARRHTET
ncbi:MAG: multidrug efflux RND transporter permease subunit [Gammaproteobacteria bacterium]|jgi:multidrug efflux pump